MDVISKEELIGKVSDPKVLPGVARRVLEIIRDEDASIAEICSIVERDQAITTSVLKVANSAFYGLRSKVTSIRQAVVVLGLKTLRNIVFAVSTKLQYKRFGITEQLMWEHSIGAAVAARHIASRKWKALEEIAFLLGLMHDLGKVFMNNECPLAYAQVMQMIYNEGEASIAAEQAIFGYDHTDVGPLVMHKWGLPSIFATVLEYHHLHKISLDTFTDEDAVHTTACIHVADNVCRRLGIGYRAPDPSAPVIDAPVMALLSLSQDSLPKLTETIRELYEQEKVGFQ
ncbi:MAG: HDOD domain-containing protein [Desulfobacterota bacterium]|nr:HDOD domain-containing protein [Thermodesulfobacteriota bacterium]